jgi:hypothetical protein
MIINMYIKWKILIYFEKRTMEYYSGGSPRTMAVKSINFKDMILSNYKGYGNELWKVESSLPYNTCIKILTPKIPWLCFSKNTQKLPPCRPKKGYGK